MSKTSEALAGIKALDDTVITAEIAAKALGVNAQSLRLQAREDPSSLGFGVICIGGNLKIPRLPFIQFLEGHSSGA